jgi:hypothetical protein
MRVLIPGILQFLLLSTSQADRCDPPKTVHRFELLKFYKNTNLRSMNSYLPIGEGAKSPANAPTAAEPKAINPSGIVAAVLMLK